VTHYSRTDLITYDIPLRTDLLVRLVLPVQFTEQDAERLCGVIRTIAMPAAILADVESPAEQPEDRAR
jgi:hypothetical protein